jgi:undecaprenyl-diphosphatase
MDKPKRALMLGFSIAAGVLVLFGWLAEAVLHGETQALDAAVRNAVHAWATPELTRLMLGITWLGEVAVLVPLAALLVWRLIATGRGRAARVFLVAAIGAEALDQILKLVFHRARPEAFFGYAEPLGYSFPSGHAIVSCCFYGVAAEILTARMRSRAGRVVTWGGAGILVAAIGFSRVYLGVHYASDVLAGYMAAVIWVAATRAAYEIRLRRTNEARSRTDSSE